MSKKINKKERQRERERDKEKKSERKCKDNNVNNQRSVTNQLVCVCVCMGQSGNFLKCKEFFFTFLIQNKLAYQKLLMV